MVFLLPIVVCNTTTYIKFQINMSLSDEENENSPTPIKRQKRIGAKPLRPITPTTMATKRSNASRAAEIVVKRSKSSIDESKVEPNNLYTNSAGVVQKIKMINIMCHGHFEVNLNPRINFISGVNGSGKSAIQTALVIGLGGMASKTNRSSKTYGLVKHGCHSGSISITLSNNGWNSYKPEDYGSSIKIVRTITPTSSTYKIYNQWGKLMAATKKELDSISTAFRIQPSNPVAILNQDMARNFLSSNRAEDKYTLFAKANRLDEADRLITSIHNNVVEQGESLDMKKKCMNTQKSILDEMQKKLKLAEQLNENRKKKYTLETEKAWSKVHMHRNELQKIISCRDEQQIMKDTFVADAEKLDAEVENLKSNKERCERVLSSIEYECKEMEDSRTRLANEFQEKKKALQDMQRELERVGKKIENLNADYEQIRQSLDNVQRQEVEMLEKKNADSIMRVNLKEQVDLLGKQMKKLEEEKTCLRNTCEHYKDQIESKKRTIKNCEDDIAQCERIIKAAGKSDDWAVYDAWMKSLVDKINKAGEANQFSKPPRGPLGRYVKVNDNKWRNAIESHLGIGFLQSFLVNEIRDRNTLYSIMDHVIKNGYKPIIHCTRFQEEKRDRQIADNETFTPGYSNMYRTLHFTDTVVANFFIDSRDIHRTLLVDSDVRCREFIERDENLPKHCQKVLNLNNDEFRPGFRIYSNPNMRPARLLKSSSATDNIRGQKEALLQKQEEIGKMNDAIATYRQELNKLNEKIQQYVREITRLKSSIGEKQGKITELTNEIECEVPSLQNQLEEMKNIESEIAQLNEKKEQLITTEVIADRAMRDIKSLLDRDKQDELFNRQTTLYNEKENISGNLKKLEAKITSMKKKVEEQKTKIETLDERIGDLKNKTRNEQDIASQLGDELADVRSPDEIRRELSQTIAFIETAEKELGKGGADFQKEFMAMYRSHVETVRTYDKLLKLHEKQEEMYRSRKQQICDVRASYANVITVKFQTVLSSRNYKGRLIFNHGNRKLDIMGVPIDGGDSFMNVNSLSGGEKSYCTVAFLLALWSNMDIPFFSMDEYDVFMDAINRKTITELLMEFAKKSSTRQFIFLTPLDVSIIKLGPDVQVHRVKKVQN